MLSFPSWLGVTFPLIDHPVVVLQETFQWNGITSKKQGQKWGTEKISSNQRNDYVNINGDHCDTHNIGEDIVTSSPIEFNELPPLPGNMPKVSILSFFFVDICI